MKTLRYYGKLGLLKPAWIDRYTSYRYYALDQLPRLNRILALKDLGFSLEQIQTALRDDLSADELRGMLRMRHAELERQIRTEQARLARIEARLRQIEREGAVPQYEVVLKGVPVQRVVGIREVIPGHDAVPRLFDELRAYLRAHDVALDATCPGLAVYYDAEFHERGVDVEAAAPIPRLLPGTSRVVAHHLPGAKTMACVVHHGSFTTLSEPYNALLAWIEANDYRVTGPNREVYLRGVAWEQDVSDCVAELQFPVEKKPIPIFMQKEKKDMEPKIVTQAAFTVVGMKYRGKNENNEIAQLWAEITPRLQEIKHIAGDAYGVCRDMEADGEFEYLAGFEVSRVEDIPAGMESWDVPANQYAVFSTTLPNIGETYRYALQTWLPGSGYQRAVGPDFERYDESFDPVVKGSQFTIYIPIK